MARRRRFPLPPHQLDVNTVAKAINIPVEQWAGNCYAIACAIVREGLVPDGRAVYGTYTGDVSPASPVFGRYASRGIHRHGWIDLGNDHVVDPTRWAFENVAPYIYEGRKSDLGICDDFQVEDPLDVVCLVCDHVEEEHAASGFMRPCKLCQWPYDEGAQALRRLTLRPFPERKPHEALIAVTYPSTEVEEHMAALAHPHDVSAGWTKGQMYWLANNVYSDLEPYAWPIYQIIAQTVGRVAVPIDNWRRAATPRRRRKAR